MSERQIPAEPEDRIFLTVDFEGDFLGLLTIAQDFKDKIHSVKLGQGYLLDDRAPIIRKELLRHHVSMYLDAKYHDDPDQMAYQVHKAGDLGFARVSVAPSAGVDSLIAAGNSQVNTRVVAAFSADNEMNNLEMRNVRSANDELEDKYKIEWGMGNVKCVERLKAMGNLTVIATGIRMPGDEVHDQPSVATPAEAFAMGADYLAVGRAITAHANRFAAFDRILENISGVE